jgi:hypothetical protein
VIRKEKRMHPIHKTLAVFAVMIAAALFGCSSDNGTSEHQGSGELTEKRGEHDGESGEHGDRGGEHGGERRGEHDRDREGHGEEGEESGTELTLTERYDKVRNGARLILAYDMKTNSFTGTVENTTDKSLKRVRVEVHLSNGKELGPTTPADLGPGEKRDVKLTAASKGFGGWTAHPEVGSSEHGNGEERGEHD